MKINNSLVKDIVKAVISVIAFYYLINFLIAIFVLF